MSLHAPFTRRQHRIPPAIPGEQLPVSEHLLMALRRGEAALTRTAQDERDIEALIQMRAAIRRASL